MKQFDDIVASLEIGIVKYHKVFDCMILNTVTRNSFVNNLLRLKETALKEIKAIRKQIRNDFEISQSKIDELEYDYNKYVIDRVELEIKNMLKNQQFMLKNQQDFLSNEDNTVPINPIR